MSKIEELGYELVKSNGKISHCVNEKERNVIILSPYTKTFYKMSISSASIAGMPREMTQAEIKAVKRLIEDEQVFNEQV